MLFVFQKYFRCNVKSLFPGHDHACTGWGLYSLGVPAQRVDLKSESPLSPHFGPKSCLYFRTAEFLIEVNKEPKALYRFYRLCLTILLYNRLYRLCLTVAALRKIRLVDEGNH